MTDFHRSIDLRTRLVAARRRLALGALSRGSLHVASLALAVWILAVATEALLWTASPVRLALLGIIVLVVIGTLIALVVWPFLRWTGPVGRIPDDEIARRVGRRFPEVSDRLLNLIQLIDGRHSDAPTPLLHQAVERLGADMADVPMQLVEDFSGTRRAARWFALPVLGLLTFVVAAPTTFRTASDRLLSPGIDFVRPAAFAIDVRPGDVSLVKGADLLIEASFSGTVLPTDATLETRLEGENVVEDIAMAVDSGRVAHKLVNLRTSLEYRISSGPVSSSWYRADVVDRPTLGRLQILLRFPAYTNRPPEPLEPDDGDITALRGTEAVIQSVVSGPETEIARVLFGSGDSTSLVVNGRNLTGSFRVLRDDEWSLSVVSTDGVSNENPVRYRIHAVDDAAPVVELVSPATDVDIDESTEVPVSWRLSDDYGFTALRLRYRLEETRFGSTSNEPGDIDLETPEPYATEQTGAHTWNLDRETPLDPVPGDVIVFWLEVADNDVVTGPKWARSAEIRVRVPSLAERYADLDEDQDDTEDALEDLAEETDELRRRFEELQDALRTKPEFDWQDERTVERMQQQQSEMERSVQDIAERIESMTDDMQKNDLVSEETLEMFRELQEVTREISSPELMEALRKLQEAMQQMDLQQMQQAMEEFNFNEEQYKERLERTLELFRNLRVQQDLEEAAKRAEELAKTEEDLARRARELEQESQEPSSDSPDTSSEEESSESPDQPSEAEQLAAEQERAAEEMESLEKKLDELRERMGDLRAAPVSEMQQLSEEVRSQQMPEEMRQNAEQLREEQMGPAQESQQKMSRQLRRMQQRLSEMMQGMQGSQMEINLELLRQALDDVLTLSTEQEALRAQVQGLSPDSPGLRETAQGQLRLSEGLTVVSDSLQSLARNIAKMSRDVQTHAGESMREMASATQAMTDHSSTEAVGFQKGAMTHLNELAVLLADLLDQMQNGQGGGSGMSMQQMMQQLSEMAGQQQRLNQQIQQMLNDMAGNRLTQGSGERLRQMAEEQQRIREQLQELGRNRELRNSALGDLERIAEQMQETIQELGSSRLSRQTLERQQQILTRLLEASHSLQERGRERRRESRTADDPANRTSPAALTPDERRERLRRDLIRALDGGYAPDYQDLIRRYFELLQQEPAGQDGEND